MNILNRIGNPNRTTRQAAPKTNTGLDDTEQRLSRLPDEIAQALADVRALALRSSKDAAEDSECRVRDARLTVRPFFQQKE
jgi:hypothetical protein